MTVAIVDCGGENLRSVQRAVESHKMKAVITNDKARVSNASFVILPGVGSAQNVMQSLESNNLIETIKSLTQPVLGICIGMHVLFDRSDEQDTECMKIIPGDVKKFNTDCGFKVPQMGWNKVTFLKEQTKDLDDHYYFANSYYSQIFNQTIATAEHSVLFTAAIQKNNFLGCQFHPEKSSFAGRKFLKYFFNKL
jgi:imidazole glycerol-phosphate synthase subunit HisH